MYSFTCGLDLRLREVNRNDSVLDLRALHSRADVALGVFGIMNVSLPWPRARTGSLKAIVFPGGRVMVPSAMTIDDAPAAVDEITRWTSEGLGTRVVASEVKPINAMGRTATARRIDLRALADELGSDLARYDPLKALSCRVTPRRDDGRSYLAFESGKILVPYFIGEGDNRLDDDLLALARERVVELMDEARELCSRFPKA